MDDPYPEPAAREMPGASQEMLWQDHKMVAVGRLSSGAAHEFNNLMQGVIASLELTRKLISGGRALDAEPFIAKAIASAQQASLLNQGVARFVRPQPIVPGEVSMNAVVADVEDVVRHSLSRAFRLEFTPAADLWTVHCDAGQAEIAIVDMILDACDGIVGGGAIAIATRNIGRPDDASASQGSDAARERVCVAVTATAEADQESLARASTLSSAHASEGAGAFDMVDHFARTYGGEFRLRGNAPQRSVRELYLPRFVAP